MSQDGRQRVVIEGITPQVDCGRFPIKRVVGDEVHVEADAFTDGHDSIAVVLRWRPEGTSDWAETLMEPLGNDRWRASFRVVELGRTAYTVEGWIDRYGSWEQDLEKRVAADQDVSVDLRIGATLIEDAASRAAGSDGELLAAWAAELRSDAPLHVRSLRARDSELLALIRRHPDRSTATTYERELSVVVDPVRGRYSAWYELFPRSASPERGRHGTFRDVIDRLPYVSAMGFDILYLPPIHPIGRTFRKGPNNVTTAGPEDPGVPWAIGAPEGGHTSVHPDLGTQEDFRALVAAARAEGIQIALDIAFQASPDHPWVAEHPEWFRARPDGTIQYAENPPKKYQDIYPFDFESQDWRALWTALSDVFLFWIAEGVTVFRVDNPHTKAFPFWEWCIGELKRVHPEILFLSEAFTRPKVMYRLAKLGFSQSYTYFTWRNAKRELAEYLLELTTTEVREFFRPNFWTNTQDILHEVLQHGGRPMFEARVVLAATMTASYGVFGPAYELLEATPREAGTEEYLDSEKYQLRDWDLDRPDSIAPLIGRLNAIRRAHPALQANDGVLVHDIDNDQLIAYSKHTADRSDIVLVVVNLDPHHPHSGTLRLDLGALGVDADLPFEVHDLLADRTYLWQGARNTIELDPSSAVAHVFEIRPRIRTEQQFEAYG